MEFVTEQQFIWEYLSQVKKPIVLYGMGDGCEKLLRACTRFKIPVSGIFASDEYVRGHSFHGFPVLRYDEARKTFGEMVILLAFAVFEPRLTEKIKRIAKENELYAPDVPLFGEGLFDRSYLEAHRAELETVYRLLADETSRTVFRSVLNYKVSGKPEYLWNCETSVKEAYYILTLGPRECYADLGAYNGDTIQEFLKVVGNRYHRIFAFEPNPKNYKKLLRSCQGIQDLQLFQTAAWNRKVSLPFRLKAGRSSAFDPLEAGRVEADSVDHLIKEPLTFVKLDVEGAERKALEGCREQIRYFKPKLAVSAYHRNEDLFSLVFQILSLRPDYRVFLRHHPYVPAWDTLYYFV